MTITSDVAWNLFNILMNNLRESITTQGKILLQNNNTHYYFEENNKDEFHLVSSNTDIVKGVTRNETGIEILVENQIGDINEYSLLYEGFTPDDFIGILERIEK